MPRWDSVPITIDAASAPETKKIATSSHRDHAEHRAERQRVEQAEQLALDGLRREVGSAALQ